MASARARRFPLQSLPPKFLSHKEERRRRIRKRDYSGAMRIKSVPLLFVDAVGTLVPTNADDRNANAIFIICVTRVVVSNISGVRAVVLCLLLSLSAKKKAKIFYRRFEIMYSLLLL